MSGPGTVGPSVGAGGLVVFVVFDVVVLFVVVVVVGVVVPSLDTPVSLAVVVPAVPPPGLSSPHAVNSHPSTHAIETTFMFMIPFLG